jgi:hypothetical protein
MKKVAAVFKLTQGLFRKFSDRGVTDIFYYEIDEDLYENYKEGSNSINLINVSGYRVPGTWKTLQYIDAVLKKIVKKSPDIFHVNGYDTYNALLKELYWSNFRIGSLYYAIEQLKGDYKIEYCQPYFKANYVKELLKWFRNSISLLKENSELGLAANQDLKKNYKIGFIINNDFIFNLYENLLSKFKADEILLILENNLNEFNKKKISTSGYNFIYKSSLSKSKTKTAFKFINPFFYSAVELEIINVFLRYRSTIIKAIDVYSGIKEFNLTKIVINEAENIPELLLLKSVLGNSTLVYNTMNGAKSGEAHDTILNINGWFVWDEFMKDFMYKNGVPLGVKLLPFGHLSFDNAVNHKFSNSFNLPVNPNPVIISLFSVNDDRPEKNSVLKLIDKILNQHPGKFLFLYRKHPAEKSDLQLPISNDFIEINYNQNNSKTTLYDQLTISDLSIVYGSTVALESTWFKVPCITFEPFPNTILHFINSAYLIHIDSIDVLENFILKTPKKNNISLSNKQSHSVSSIYHDYLLSN